MADSSAELVPSSKLITNLKPLIGNGKRKVVLFTTGAYCPIHLMHTALFDSAKQFLEKNYNIDVVAGCARKIFQDSLVVDFFAS